MGIGTLETHPIDMITGYGTIANGGVRMSRTTLLKVLDDKDQQVWPQPETQVEGERVVSRQAAYIITDILAGNTQVKINPYWGKWAVYDGKTRRPAAYKTGTTNDNRDVHAYGYLAPPKDKKAQALVVGVWMGNSNNQPMRILSLDAAAPLWSAIMQDVSRDLPIVKFKAPPGLEKAKVDAFTGRRPGPFTTKTVTELFIEGTVPKKKEGLPRRPQHRRGDGPALAGRLRRAAGHARLHGPLGGRGELPELAAANRNWALVRIGVGVRGGPKGTRRVYFHDGRLRVRSGPGAPVRRPDAYRLPRSSRHRRRAMH